MFFMDTAGHYKRPMLMSFRNLSKCYLVILCCTIWTHLILCQSDQFTKTYVSTTKDFITSKTNTTKTPLNIGAVRSVITKENADRDIKTYFSEFTDFIAGFKHTNIKKEYFAAFVLIIPMVMIIFLSLSQWTKTFPARRIDNRTMSKESLETYKNNIGNVPVVIYYRSSPTSHLTGTGLAVTEDNMIYLQCIVIVP
ncbi:hypothetical protein Btru_040724 [Bulinus truncatus]|nr:hypothetical protein Btru_040724 [Bulinus truncatus]